MGVVGKLVEGDGHHFAHVVVVSEEEWRIGLARRGIEPACEQVLPVVEGGKVDGLAAGRLAQRLRAQRCEVLAEAPDAVLAEAGAVLHGAKRRRGFVELHAVHTGVDLQANDRLDVVAPDRVVPIHVVAVLRPVGRFDPAGVIGLSVEPARGALLEEIGDLLAVAVDQAGGEIAREALPQLRITVLGEFPEPELGRLAGAAQFVEGEDLAFVVVQFDAEFPSLGLEDDAEDVDAPFAALGDEFPVRQGSVEPIPRRHGAVDFMFQEGERDRATAEGGPHQHGAAITLKIPDLEKSPRRQARVVAVVAAMPRIEIDGALHDLCLRNSVGRHRRVGTIGPVPRCGCQPPSSMADLAGTRRARSAPAPA